MTVKTVFMTGITGLVGNAVARQLLTCDESVRIIALVRDAAAWRQLARTLSRGVARVTPVRGDIRAPGLALSPDVRRRLRRHASIIVHCAADTQFSQRLDAARSVNAAGTAHLLALAADWPLERFVHLSTAFVAGARTGHVAEGELDAAAGFVNAYEQSKYEAESAVRRSGVPWVIVRSSTIVCDDESGSVSQVNAVHRALRVCHAGLVPLMPSHADARVDLVTAAYVARSVADIALHVGAARSTFHLCAGLHALPLAELLDRAFAIWRRDPQWRRRGVERPVLTDLSTYQLFEETVHETGDLRLCAVMQSLSHFAPQLALPKTFETAATDATLGYGAPAVHGFWDAMVARLAGARFTPARRAA